jgi:hypothetical protein
MFIAVTQHQHRMREIPAYLYEGQSVIRQPEENYFGTYTAIVDTGTDSEYRSNYVRERLASGMFGAVLFATREEADQYVEDGKKL